jgi:hypothetical protein
VVGSKVTFNKALFPGIIIKGKETPHPNRKTAGMLFFSDEGTENGGLVFGGARDKDGTVSSYGHLSFDEYEQDQVFTIDAEQQGDKRASALTIVDRPSYSICDLIELTNKVKGLSAEEQKAEIAKFGQSHPSPHQRLYLGRSDDKSVALRLKDVEGHDRIVIQVAPDGSPTLQFINKDGRIISQLPQLEKK